MAGNLLRQCVLFGRLLRGVGVPVSAAQLVTLAEALGYVDLADKQEFRLCACAVLVSRREHLAPFDQAFEWFWRAQGHDGRPPDLPEILHPERRSRSLAISGAPAVLPLQDAASRPERTLAYSAVEVLRHKDFRALTAAERETVARLVRELAWAPPPRRTRRRTRARAGARLDLRATLRRSLRHGGEPLRLAFRQRTEQPRPLVVLCDVSGSMAGYARLLLEFVYVLVRRERRTEVFLFGTRLTRITRFLREGPVDQALGRAMAAAVDWGGGTRIGAALGTFNRTWGRRVLGRGAWVLLLSDGCDRGDPELLAAEVARLQRTCSRLLWLNPLLGDRAYRPEVRGMRAALPFVDDFLPVNNLASLEQLAALLVAGAGGCRR